MLDAALLVERGHRLGPNDLAPGRVHRAIGDVVVDHAQGRLDHLAAVVGLGDDAIGAVPLIGGDRDAGPLDRRVMPRQISEHVAAALRILASDDDPGFVGIRSSPATFFELAELITLAQLIACPEREARADAHAEFAEGELRVSRQ